VREIYRKEVSSYDSKDNVNILKVVKAYLCLASNVFRGLAYQDQWSRSWEECIFESKDLHARLVGSPFSPYPLVVRQVLAQSNYLGNWILLEYLILPGLDVSCKYWSFFTFRWIMVAAIGHVADPTGKVWALLNKFFNLDCLSVILHVIPCAGFGLQLHVPGKVDLDEFNITDETGNPEAEAGSDPASIHALSARCIFEDPCHDPVMRSRWFLEFVHGNVHYTINNPLYDLRTPNLPQIEGHWLTQRVQCFSLPQPDEECTICQEDFTTVSCVRTICNRVYHSSCLHKWQESLQDRGIDVMLCCYCRRELMTSDELKRLEEVERKGVPMHLTVKQHKEQHKRAVFTFAQLF
jgi:hypothetical protein